MRGEDGVNQVAERDSSVMKPEPKSIRRGWVQRWCIADATMSLYREGGSRFWVTCNGLVVSGLTAFAVEPVTTNPLPATHNLDSGWMIEGRPMRQPFHPPP
jgi:hypothetical protein